MRRHERTDGEWRLDEPLLPRQSRGGRWNGHRTTLGGMLWVLRTGAPWRDLPERFGRWQSVDDRFNRWRRDGTFDRIAKALRIRLDRQGKIDWDPRCIDAVIPQRSNEATRWSATATSASTDAPAGAGSPWSAASGGSRSAVSSGPASTSWRTASRRWCGWRSSSGTCSFSIRQIEPSHSTRGCAPSARRNTASLCSSTPRQP